MALKGNQLDKASLQNCVVTPAQRKEQKRQHRRKVRRSAKRIDEPVAHNRYGGWVA